MRICGKSACIACLRSLRSSDYSREDVLKDPSGPVRDWSGTMMAYGDPLTLHHEKDTGPRAVAGRSALEWTLA